MLASCAASLTPCGFSRSPCTLLPTAERNSVARAWNSSGSSAASKFLQSSVISSATGGFLASDANVANLAKDLNTETPRIRQGSFLTLVSSGRYFRVAGHGLKAGEGARPTPAAPTARPSPSEIILG